MATGYEDIENLTNRQNEMLDNSLQQQKDIINKQTEMNVAEIQKNKEDVDKDVEKTNKALYSEYKKASNPYGANAENLYTRGLGNSGYAETTQTNLYNTYQRNITDTLNNARDLKANFDNEITKARQTGDITLAQNALDIYNQKMQLLTQEYQLKNNREQFLYQQSRDKVSDDQWLQQFNYTKAIDDRNYNYQKSIDDRNYNYQRERDAVADDQWLKEYELSKKASATSSRRSSSSGSGSSSKSTLNVNEDSPIDTGSNTSQQNSNAQALLQKSLETASQITSKSGRERFLNDLGNACYQAMQQGMISSDQMEDIVTQVSAKFG